LSPSYRFGEGNSSFQGLWEDGKRVFCLQWRSGADGERSATPAVLPAAERPPPALLDRFAHEHGLKDELDGARVLRPLELARDRDRPMLVLEDGGGEPLERLLGAPRQLGGSSPHWTCGNRFRALLESVREPYKDSQADRSR
jgi:hypothetical protein